MNATTLIRLAGLSVGILLVTTGCEVPPQESIQRGYRGTGMVHVASPEAVAKLAAANQVPEAAPPIPPGGPKAKEIYKNVKVLGDLDVGQFTRLMVAMTSWVSPEGGCNYCHEAGNFESDSVYTKVVSRRMLEMTRSINSEYKTHVGETGVTCYTCHRGNPVPKEIWFADNSGSKSSHAGWRYGQNEPARTVGRSSLPKDPFSTFLAQPGQIGVASAAALPVKNAPGTSIQHAEWTYGLMMHFSDSLGVNCTYCHNSRAFSSWSESSTPRVTAWHGIRMVRTLNTDYLEPLKPVYPATRLGPEGDAPKAHCATCHQGANKPLLGVSMLKDHPELSGAPAAPAVVAPAEAPAVAAASTKPDVKTKDAPKAGK
jgi:photosynthetic reaction center cytochrome c subunit